MAQFIYICTNESMPGKIKVGKTEICPSERIARLQSTGVPTAFKLEFSAEVDDCHAREKAAHQALASYRVTANREFFEIDYKEALEIILPVLGNYRAYQYQQNSETESCLEHDRKRQRRLKDQEHERLKKAEADRRAAYWAKKEQHHRNQQQEVNRQIQRRILKEQITKYKKDLSNLGPEPILNAPNPFVWGIPIWLIGLAFSSIFTELVDVGKAVDWVRLILMVGSWFVGGILYKKYKEKREDEYLEARKPRVNIEREIENLQHKLTALDPTNDQKAPICYASKSGKIVRTTHG